MPGALLTDLYQLTMLQAYHDGGMNAPARKPMSNVNCDKQCLRAAQ